MCGIAGILCLGGTLSERHRTETTRTMTGLLVHRGPDGEGYYANGPVALGNRRLSIIDLAQGAQPMSDPAGQVWITFNGEIYNHRELRSDLEARGYRFRTHSDTEVLIAAYITYGTDFLDTLNGMFGFALWDERSQRLLLARDRLGIKPLYYTVTEDQHLVFASEPKSVLAFPGVSHGVDLQGLASYLEFRYPVGERTFYQGLSQLGAGHLLIAGGGQVRRERWWRVPAPEPAGEHSEEAYREELHELVTTSVAYRMIADVPICCFLSGGLDSTIIAGCMARQSGTKLMTFTTGFPGDDFNEFRFARMAADHFDTDHHEVVLDENGYLDATRELIRYKDGPLTVPHEPAIYLMSKEIARHAKVVLSGEGADELFGGYGRIMRSSFDYDRMRMLSQGGAPDLPQPARVAMEGALDQRYGKAGVTSLADFFLDQYSYFPAAASELLSVDLREALHRSDARQYIREKFDEVSSAPSIDQCMWVFENVHLQALLGRLDCATMAASVEARGPFLDHRLVEFGMRLPLRHKMRWRSSEAEEEAWTWLGADISDNLDIPKYLLRQAFRGEAPDDLLWRRKEPFSVPLEGLTGGYHAAIREVLLDQSVAAHGLFDRDAIEALLQRGERPTVRRMAQALWMLANVEMWLGEGLGVAS